MANLKKKRLQVFHLFYQLEILQVSFKCSGVAKLLNEFLNRTHQKRRVHTSK